MKQFARLFPLLFVIGVFVFCPEDSLAQNSVSKARCQKLGFSNKERRKMSPGVMLALKGMPDHFQCGVLYERSSDRSGLGAGAKELSEKEIGEIKSIFQEEQEKARSRHKAEIEQYNKLKKAAKEKKKSKPEDPANFLISLVIDARGSTSDLEQKVNQLLEAGKSNDLSVGGLILLGMDQVSQDSMNQQLTNLYKPKVVKSKEELREALSSPIPSLILNDVENVIVSKKFRRKGHVNGKELFEERKIDRLPIWIVTSKEEEKNYYFDGVLKVSDFFLPFGELDKSQVLDSKKAHPRIVKKASKRDWIFVVDEFAPDLSEIMNSGTKGPSRKLDRF